VDCHPFGGAASTLSVYYLGMTTPQITAPAFILDDDVIGPVAVRIVEVHQHPTGYTVTDGRRTYYRLAVFDTAEEASLVQGQIDHDLDL
jgi:hypothetical protein